LKKNLKKIYRIIVKKNFDIIYGKLILASEVFFKNNVLVKKVFFSNNKGRSYNVYIVDNCRVYSDNSENVAVIKNKYLLPKISIQLGKNQLIEASNNNILKTGTRKLIQKKVKGNVLCLIQGISAINNYGHWILDILPKLCVAEKYKDLNDFDAIYLPNIKKKFQIDSLSYFGINPNKFIDGSAIRHIYAEKLTIPQHPYWKINKGQLDTVANIDPDIINLLKQKFMNIQNVTKAKRIFIDRSDSNFFHNQIINYKDVSKILKDNHFKKIKLTELTFIEQISYFKNAEIIVGAHGAGLVNIIFCKPKTKVIEFSNSNYVTDIFKNICKVNSCDYHKMYSTVKAPTTGIAPDIQVSISDLIKLIA
jgi:hypothetical protein